MTQFRHWWGRHRKYKEKFSQEVDVAGRNEFRRRAEEKYPGKGKIWVLL